MTIPGKFDHPVIEVPLTARHACRRARLGARPGGDPRRARGRAGLVILCNPWNPVGRVLREDELRALHDVVREYDALVFSDEIHSSLVLMSRFPFVSYASLGPSSHPTR